MLVLLAEGMTVTAVVQRVGVTRRSVSLWARRFLQEGLEGLGDTPGRGPPTSVDDILQRQAGPVI